MREDGARLVRLCRERHDHAAALARDTVRTNVALDRKPSSRLVVAGENALSQPFPVEPNRLTGRLGQGHVDDVVRAAPIQLCTLGLVDGVVGGCHEIRQRAGRAGVADGAERLDVGHRGERTNGLSP